MLKVDGKTIHINRGYSGVLTLTIKDYTFKSGDEVTMGVYEKKGFEKTSKLFKTVTVSNACDSVDIELTSSDTSIDTIANKPITYWYEIELNNNQTVIGYDEDGAATLILYPEGSDLTESSSSDENNNSTEGGNEA